VFRHDKGGRAFHVLDGPSGIGKSITALISPCPRRLYFVYNIEPARLGQSLYHPYAILSSRLVRAAIADTAEHIGVFYGATDFVDRSNDIKLRTAAVLKAILEGLLSSSSPNPDDDQDWLNSLAFADIGPVDSNTKGCLLSELEPLVTLTVSLSFVLHGPVFERANECLVMSITQHTQHNVIHAHAHHVLRTRTYTQSLSHARTDPSCW
jgi:hypothetical protein